MSMKKPNRLKQPFWRSPVLWGLLVLLIAGSAGGWFFWGKDLLTKSSSTTTASAVRTTAVTKGNVLVSASGSGTLQAGQSVDLTFSIMGTVGEVNVKVGDTVKTGQVLASLVKSSSLEANVSSAQLALLQDKNAVTDLQTNADVNLAQAYQDYLSAQTSYSAAVTAETRTAGARCSKEVVERYKEAYDQAATKLDDLTTRDNGSQAWTIAKYDYATASANYTYCASYTDAEKASAKSTTAVVGAALKNAETTYNTLKTAAGVDPTALNLAEVKLKNAQTQLAKAQEDLAGLTLTAPIDGKVVYLAAGTGAIVDKVKFITIASVTKPVIQVSVDEADLDKLAVGNAAEVVFDALPEQVFNGTVTTVNPQLTQSGQYRVTTGTIELDATAVTAVQNLPLGLSATVTIVSKEVKDVLIVPVAAIKSLGKSQYAVMLKGADGTLKQTSVTVGLQNTSNAEITSGLKQGDRVGSIFDQTGTTSSSSSKSSSTQNSNAGGMPLDGGGPPPGQ